MVFMEMRVDGMSTTTFLESSSPCRYRSLKESCMKPHPYSYDARMIRGTGSKHVSSREHPPQECHPAQRP